MKKSIIKILSFFIIMVLSLCPSFNAYADHYINTGIGIDFSLCNRIQVIGDHLKMTSKTTGTFQYKCMYPNGEDITSKVLPGNIKAEADVHINSFGATHSAAISLDPKSGTGTVTYDFDDDCKKVSVQLELNTGGTIYGCREDLNIGDLNPEFNNAVDRISFLKNSLTDTGKNTAEFIYGIYGKEDKNITKDIPVSQIEAFSAVYSTTFSAITMTTSSAIEVDPKPSSDETKKSTTSSTIVVTNSSTTTTYSPITLDQSQGKGTIKFNTPCTDKITTTTLVDKSTGRNQTLNTVGLDGSKLLKLSATEVYRIDFASDNLVKTAPNKAKFEYKVKNHSFKNINDTIPESDIDAYAVIGTSKVKAILDPVSGEGTLNYNFSDADKDALVTITYKTGVTICERLNIVNSESESIEDKNNKDLGISKIEFMPTGPSIYYHVLNKYGRDITDDIPFSQIAASSSINCIVSLSEPSMGKMGTWKQFAIQDGYDRYYDPDRTVIITLMDRLSGVKASLNIGDSPKDISKDMPKEDKADNETVTFKDAVLEKSIRKAINKAEGDIIISDVKNITDLSVDAGCTDLSGIQNLVGLKSLQLCPGKINSLEPLRKLTGLQILQYYTDSMTDLEPLENLKNLNSLEISCKQITTRDIYALEKLTNLKFLDLHDTKISGVGIGALKLALEGCYILN